MKLSLNLPAALVAALKTRAAAERRSRSNLVALLLERQLTVEDLAMIDRKTKATETIDERMRHLPQSQDPLCENCGHPVPPHGVWIERERDYDRTGQQRARCEDTACVCAP